MRPLFWYASKPFYVFNICLNGHERYMLKNMRKSWLDLKWQYHLMRHCSLDLKYECISIELVLFLYLCTQRIYVVVPLQPTQSNVRCWKQYRLRPNQLFLMFVSIKCNYVCTAPWKIHKRISFYNERRIFTDWTLEQLSIIFWGGFILLYQSNFSPCHDEIAYSA